MITLQSFSVDLRIMCIGFTFILAKCGAVRSYRRVFLCNNIAGRSKFPRSHVERFQHLGEKKTDTGDINNDANTMSSLLLQRIVERSIRTLSQVDSSNVSQNIDYLRVKSNATSSSNTISDDIKLELQAGVNRAIETLHLATNNEMTTQSKDKCNKDCNNTNSITYSSHPAVKGTALAHLLWKTIICPWEDTVIDATCGNGKDSLALAQMLFSSDASYDQLSNDKEASKPELICIDIQEQALANTTSLLWSKFGKGINNVFRDYITIIERSHERLPKPRDERKIGLICYNLGFLPGSDNKFFQTRTKSTISSLADAAIMIRRGGMISVMTYPGTNAEEAQGVRLFLSSLAMFSSKISSWEDYLRSGGESSTSSSRVRLTVEEISHLRDALQRTLDEGGASQVWRVFEHNSLGRPLSPVLITATKIRQ